MKKMIALTCTAGLIAGLTIASAAGAQNATSNPHAGHGANQAAPSAANQPASADAEFVKLDKDKDGSVARAELPAKHALVPHFDMADQNKDGKLDKKEFAAGMAML